MNANALIGARVTQMLTTATTLNTGGTASVTSGAFSNTEGAEYVLFVVAFGAIAGGGGLSVLKVQESTTSGGTYSDISNADYIAAGKTLADTSDNGVALILLRTRGRQLHYKIVATTAGAVNTIINSIVAVALPGKVAAPQSTGGIDILYVG